MPVTPIIFITTQAGRDAAADAINNLPDGKLRLTTVRLGQNQYTPTGDETALQDPYPNTFSIGGGGVQAGSGQIRFTPILASASRLEAFEIGLYSDTGVLFAIAATTGSAPLLVIDPNVQCILSMNIAFGDIDADSIEIVVDVNAPLAVVMMGQHLSAVNPHPQYGKQADLLAEVAARIAGDLSLAIALAGETSSRESDVAALQAGLAVVSGNASRFGWPHANNGVIVTSGGSTFTLKAGQTMRVLLIGGGGGSSTYEQYGAGEVQDQTNGGDSYLQINGVTVITAGGGYKGTASHAHNNDDGDYDNGTMGGIGVISFNDNYALRMHIIRDSMAGLPGYVGNSGASPNEFFNFVYSGFNAFGKGATTYGFITNKGYPGAGGPGAIVEFYYTNLSSADVIAYVYAGARGTSDTASNDGFPAAPDNATGGVAYYQVA
jgi:hypothetical protein